MELRSKFYLVDDSGEKFMGAGVLWLLKAIEETGSLRKAAVKMNISYSKAYRMINNLEQNLGRTVVNRKKGGQERMGAQLTSFGSEFYKLYDEFQKMAKSQLEKPYFEFKIKLDSLMED